MRLKRAFMASVLSAVVVVFMWAGAKLDLLLNPWIKNTEYAWYNIFTTRHYMSNLLAGELPTSDIAIVTLWLVGLIIFYVSKDLY